MKARQHTQLPAHSAFTLIELLVVISIISLLSSIVFASASYARARATDTAQAATVHSVQTAVAAYIAENGEPPPNFQVVNGEVSACTFGVDPGCDVAFSNEPASIEVVMSGNSEPVLTNRFGASMSALVNSGYLSRIPESANRNSPLGYIDFGPENQRGAVVLSALPTQSATVQATPGTCRFTVDGDDEQGEQSVSQSVGATFLAALTAKIAQANEFFNIDAGEPQFIANLAPTSGLLRSRGFIQIDYVGEELSAEQLTLVSPCGVFSSNCSSNPNENQSLTVQTDPNSIEIPTCSDQEENRSHCVCNPY